MGKYRLVVLTDAVEGREDEYNEWYTNRHLADVVAVPGFTSAQRFKIRTLVMGEFKNQYMAIYVVDAEDPDKAVDHLMSLRDTDAMIMSAAINLDTANVALFEERSEIVVA